MRGLSLRCQVPSYGKVLARCTGCFGTVWFALLLSGRGSHVDWCTRAAHAAADGNAAPGALIAKYPAAGGLAALARRGTTLPDGGDGGPIPRTLRARTRNRYATPLRRPATTRV